MSNVTFLRAGHSDIPMLVDYRILFSNELAGKQDAALEKQLRDSATAFFQRELNKGYICWYAHVNGDIAALAGLVIRSMPGNIRNPSGVWGYIINVYTLPHHRRKGFSTQVIERLIASGREAGVTAFELHATAAGEPVYRKMGFGLHPEPMYRLY